MRTPGLIALVGLVTVVAVAGMALASGSVTRALGMQGDGWSGGGMMGDHSGWSGMHDGSYGHMHQNQWNVSGGCMGDNSWNYSYDEQYNHGDCPCMN